MRSLLQIIVKHYQYVSPKQPHWTALIIRAKGHGFGGNFPAYQYGGRVWSQVSPSGICGEQSGTRVGLTLNILFFPSQCHSPRMFHTLTSRSRVLLEKLTGSRLVKKFPAFYRTWRFVTAFTLQPVAILNQHDPVRTSTFHFLKIHLNIIPHPHLGQPSGLFPSCFPTKTLYMPLRSPIRGYMPCPSHSFLITRTILGEEYRSLSSPLCSFLHSHYLIPLRPKFFSAPYSQTPSACVPPSMWDTLTSLIANTTWISQLTASADKTLVSQWLVATGCSRVNLHAGNPRSTTTDQIFPSYWFRTPLSQEQNLPQVHHQSRPAPDSLVVDLRPWQTSSAWPPPAASGTCLGSDRH